MRQRPDRSRYPDAPGRHLPGVPRRRRRYDLKDDVSGLLKESIRVVPDTTYSVIPGELILPV